MNLLLIWLACGVFNIIYWMWDNGYITLFNIITLFIMGPVLTLSYIVPLSRAKTIDEVYKLCHYTNLQPLWASDNLRKSDK